MKKYSKGEIAEIILKTLLVAGIIVMIVGAPNTAQLLKYIQPKNARERERVKRSFQRLERRGLLLRQKTGDRETWRLSQNGKQAARFLQLKKLSITRQKTWDNLWRLIIFDIPESKRKARHALRHTLTTIGCTQYQESVFLTPFPCAKEINFIGETFGVRAHIRLIVAKEIEEAGKFKKLFDL